VLIHEAIKGDEMDARHIFLEDHAWTHCAAVKPDAWCHEEDWICDGSTDEQAFRIDLSLEKNSSIGERSGE
jgi:hypothetical protein